MNKFSILLIAAFATVVFTSGSALALDFNVTYSTPVLNSSTQNQTFLISIGNNISSSSNNASIISLQLGFFTADGIAVVNGTNFTSNVSATNSGILNFTNILQFPQTVAVWGLKNLNGSWAVVPYNSIVNFSMNVGTPLGSNPPPVIVTAVFSNGTVESRTVFFSLNAPAVTGVVTLKGPGNATVWTGNNVNIQFNVNGTASQYACLAFVNQTTPFGTQFLPAAAPPNFNVTNGTNTNMTIFLSNGAWQWNVKCSPKNSYLANRTSNGYNVTLNGQPASLNSFQVGDIVTFTNNLVQRIRITLQPPFSPPYVIDLAPGASNSTDTSPDFSNPLSQKPPLLGPFIDNATDQFTSNFLGGFGQSGDPRFAPGNFAAANFTLNVSGGLSNAGFDPGNFFNPGSGFSFSGGPCSLPVKPAFCNQQAAGGVSFDPNDAGFFDSHPGFQMSGFTDCTNPANVAKTDCQILFNPNARITGDTTPPNTLFTKINAFSDKVFVDMGTDKASNATLDYYGGDQYCGNKLVTITDDGVRNPSTGVLIQNSRFKPFHHFEISSVTFSNITLSVNSTYYYKTNLCDPAGNCVSSSSCKGLNSSTVSFASTPIGLNFTIPSGFDFKFRFPNGTEATISSTGNTSFANLVNVTMRFQPTGANWGIDLPASAMATASSFDFSNGFKTVSSGGRTFVGMNKTVWDGLAQRLGITAINMTIIGTGDTLNKCDDSGGNCNDVTSLAVKVATNATAGTATWTIPATLGFSTYVDNPTAISTAASSSPSSAGGTSSTTAVTKEIRNIIIGTVPAMLVMNNPGTHGVVEIDVAVNNPTGTVQVSVDTLGTSKPASVAQDVAGTVYRYLDISVGINDSNVASANVTFNVNSSWLTQNSIDPSTVTLDRYHNGAWQNLTTALVSSNSTIYTYMAQTPGFSTFAITGQKPSQPAAPATTPGQTPTQAPTQTAAPITSSSLLMIIIGIIVVVVATLGIFYFMRKHRS